MNHDHPNPGVLTIGCPACIVRRREAEIASAPPRICTWTCTYEYNGPKHLQFTKTVPVPDGWTGDQVDAHYAGSTSEWFVMALPFTIVPVEHTDWACETMEVRGVMIGGCANVVRGGADPTDSDQLPLF